MPFVENPLRFVAETRIDNGRISFRSSSQVVTYVPRKGAKVPARLVFDDAYAGFDRLNPRWWQLKVLPTRAPKGPARFMELSFDGPAFTKHCEAIGLFNGISRLSTEQKRERLLYDAFVNSARIQLLAPLRAAHERGEDHDCGHVEFVEGLIVDLHYRACPEPEPGRRKSNGSPKGPKRRKRKKTEMTG